jgi:hypothetical protein
VENTARHNFADSVAHHFDAYSALHNQVRVLAHLPAVQSSKSDKQTDKE